MNKRARREAMYELLYKQAQQVLEKHNPCKVKSGICHRRTKCCCSSCHNLGENGCKVKALWCKLWICGFTAYFHPKAYQELQQLTVIAKENELIYPRATKEKALTNQDDLRWVSKNTVKTPDGSGWATYAY